MTQPDAGLEANAGEGGAGAPPETHEANRLPSDVTREYASESIRVQWFASRCIHSAACIRALPRVFDPRRRPWVDVNAADADAIAVAVVKCPTGALHFQRTDGGLQESSAGEVAITAVRDGPYFLRGPVQVKDSEGRVLREDTRVALCRCGQSKHMPFCDNTHRAIGFRTP
ncbi:MAG TPA: CDGSH iron-sulfur domain-containing protein [Gemmatimonadaceae bacterium]